MTLQQLLCLTRVVDCGLNVSRAAKAMHTSQPGVSRHLKVLERELGVDVFVRDGKRLVQLTPIGKEVVAAARRVLQPVEDLRSLAAGYRVGDVGSLTVATAHTLARYSLPPVVRRFTEQYPRVRLHLRQGYGSQLVDWVAGGEADLCIGAAPERAHRDVALVPCGQLHRIVLVPAGHALLRKKRLRLGDIAEYPILTYDDGASVFGPIGRAFNASGIVPNVVLTASDADVIKTYVTAGLGIAIVVHLVFDPEEDRRLRAIDARHLFESSDVHVGLRRGTYVPAYLARFVELFEPSFTRKWLSSAVSAA